MLEELITFFKSCPLLAGYRILPDFLSEKAGSICIRAIGDEPILYRYTDGGNLKQFTFKLLSRKERNAITGYSEEAFYTELAAWVEEADLRKLLMRKGLCAQRMEVLKSGAVTDIHNSCSCYEMTCRLIYYQKGERNNE